jgi:hypothetical protein
MALTVRPDDEVYQFDTVWLGPDEYTLPIQARYVAWGTWLACFLVAAVVLIPLGGNGPAGVLGSVIWSLGLSVVLSRAVMLVVDHERPLRSLPALFSAEARAALQARRRSERSLLIRPGKIKVRETPPKVLAMRERQRSRAAARSERKHHKHHGHHESRPSSELAVPAPALESSEPARTPDFPVGEWYAEPTPGWSVAADEHETYEPVPVRTPRDEVRGFVRAPDPEPQHARHAAPDAAPGAAPDAAPRPEPQPQPQQPAVPVAATAGSPFRADPHQAERAAYQGPLTVSPNAGRHAKPARDEKNDPHAALEARILLPARKDR